MLASFPNLPWDEQVEMLRYIVDILDEDDGRNVVLVNLRQVCIVTCSALASLRSVVVRVGISTLSTLFNRLGQSMESEIEVLMDLVVKKASNGGNKFIRDEAIALLSVISASTSPSVYCKSLLDFVVSKNDSIRQLMTVFIASCLRKSGDKIASNRNLISKLVTTLETLLNDKSAAVRESAREGLAIIRASLGKVKFSKFCSFTTPSAVVTAIDVGDGRSRNRCIRSAPPEPRKTRSIAIDSTIPRRRESSVSRDYFGKEDDRNARMSIQNRRRSSTPSPKSSDMRYHMGSAALQAPHTEDYCLNRKSIGLVDVETRKSSISLMNSPQPVAYGRQSYTGQTVPQFLRNSELHELEQISIVQHSVYEDKFLGRGSPTLLYFADATQNQTVNVEQAEIKQAARPRIFELSLLHRRMKPCASQAVRRYQRTPEVLLSGRASGESAFTSAVAQLQASSLQRTL